MTRSPNASSIVFYIYSARYSNSTVLGNVIVEIFGASNGGSNGYHMEL